MAEYLSLPEVRAQKDEIRAALDDLLARPRVALRPNSRQWVFLRQSLERLLTGGEVPCAFTRQQATQYKFEVDECLRRFYLRAGRPAAFVFRLMDRRRAIALMLVDDTYPRLLDYVLLVATARPEVMRAVPRDQLRDYLPRVVDQAARAEFAVYQKLPAVDLSPLQGCFVLDGPAYRRIWNVAEQHRQRGWVIAEPVYNPSTMRVMKVRVLEVSENHAFLRSQEYWYLRWWSLREQTYVQVYQETNYQRYGLVREGDKWLVALNEYPQPRSIAVIRKARRQSA